MATAGQTSASDPSGSADGCTEGPSGVDEPSVYVLVGRKHERRSVAGVIQRDACGFVCLSALVGGGDGDVPDKLKRFRLFVCSRGETVKARGCGTFFHPSILEAFIDKFGDPAMACQNVAVRTAIPGYVRHAERIAAERRTSGVRDDDVGGWFRGMGDWHDDEDVPLSPRSRELVLNVSKCCHDIFMPRGLTSQQALARLGYVVDSETTARANLRTAQRRFHPDRVHRCRRPTGVTLGMMRLVNEEIFKSLMRLDA